MDKIEIILKVDNEWGRLILILRLGMSLAWAENSTELIKGKCYN